MMLLLFIDHPLAMFCCLHNSSRGVYRQFSTSARPGRERGYAQVAGNKNETNRGWT